MRPLKKILGLLLCLALVGGAAAFYLFSGSPNPPPLAAPTPPPAAAAPPPAAAPLPPASPKKTVAFALTPNTPPSPPSPDSAPTAMPTFTPAVPPPPTVPDIPGTTDLGTVEFSDGVPLTVNLGQGKSCTITPTAQPDGTLLLSLVLVAPGENHADSDTTASPRVITRPGQTIAVSVGQFGVKLTPTLKGN